MLIATKPELPAEAREREMRAIRPIFRDEAAAGHALGNRCLELEQCLGWFDLREEDACALEGAQACKLQMEGRECQFREFAHNEWDCEFGNLSQEDQGEVDVFGWGAARLGKLDRLCEADEGMN